MLLKIVCTEVKVNFSFARFGFWKLIALGLMAETLHLGLQSHWPDIQGSRIGKRSLGALIFMSVEALIILAALAAGIGTLSEAAKSHTLDFKLIILIASAMSATVLLFLWVWH
jgi:hypothetical protein